MNYAGYGLLLEESGLALREPDEEVDTAASRRSAIVPQARHAKPRGENGWDLLWIAVNESTLSKGQKCWNAKVRLTRAELLEVLVRGAIDGKPASEMTRCVNELCEDLLFLGRQPHAGTILHDANAFRRTYCYRREVCAVLEHHETTLRNVFAIYAEEGSGGVDVTGSSKLLGVSEWWALMRDLGLVKEISVRRTFHIFSHARCATIDESTRKSQIGQLTQLSYEGFLEAIVRLSMAKALPTDKGDGEPQTNPQPQTNPTCLGSHCRAHHQQRHLTCSRAV